MKNGLPAPTMRLFRGKARVFVPALVEELVGAIRKIAPRESGDGINNLPKLRLGLLELVFRLFPILDVDTGSIPSNDVSMFIVQRHLAMEHPAVLTIAAAHATFIFEDLSARKAGFPPIEDTFEIIGINPACPIPALNVGE